MLTRVIIQTPCLRKNFTQGSTARGSRAAVRAQTWVFRRLHSNQLIASLLQPTKYEWAPLSKLRLSGNGCSRTIRERQESAACFQIPRRPALAMTNKPIPGLRKNDPADPASAKVYLLALLLSLLCDHEVNLLKVEHQAQRNPRKRR